MLPSFTIRKNVSPLQVTLIVILVISLFYPLFFAYIDKVFEPDVLLRELFFTAARLSGIAFICYGIIRLTNYVFHGFKAIGLRYLVEIILILFLTYWFLVAFLEGIDRPLTGSNPADPNLWTFRRYIGLYMLGTIFIYTFLSGLNIYQEAQRKAAQAERLQRDFAQVRLQALKSQVNPHFLFNSLSVLSSLVQVNPELSEKFIIQLSKAYRYILEQKDLELVTLKEELNFLDAYFFLLQIRFNQKVQLHKDIEVDADAYRLPPLTLQLLVENAVKHNKMSAGEPLAIALIATEGNLVVKNNISLRDDHTASTGIGLQNIQKRYALVTDKKVVIEKDEKQFSVQLPLLKTTA